MSAGDPRRLPAGTPASSRGYEGFGGAIGRTFTESQPWWPPEPVAPAGAPNIVLMLLDDMGYSDIAPFGSEVATPTLDRLAATGLRLTNYHTTPVCSPARAAMLTGLNPHRAGYATVAAFDTGFPAYTFEIADDVLTLPEILRDAGYATYAVGKWHLSRQGLTHDAAIRRSWPTQRGFDRYYGCLEGFTSYMAPNRLIRDQSPISVERYPDDYYLTDDLTDEAIGMIHSLRAHDARKPFFLYFAHHAMHAPFAAKPADIAKYRGRYDAGWDVLREERFARQIASGLFPEGTRLPWRNSEGPARDVPAWAELRAAQKAKCARLMEVYAAMVDNVDQNLARLIAAIDAYGELDNTIVIFTSDNGGANDGGRFGTRSYLSNFVGPLGRELPEDWDRDVAIDLDLMGGPRTMLQYPRGWAMLSNTPFRLYKGTTFAGGVRTPFIVSWPAGLQPGAEDDSLRPQYAYVTDVLPTRLDAVGVERPAERLGEPVKELDGSTFVSVLRDRDHPETHTQQYCEFDGQRGLYRDGWKILTLHNPGDDFDDQEWQLFDVRNDPTETTDVSAENPDLTAELAAIWEREAWMNTVFPLDDHQGHLRNQHRPSADALSEPVTFLPGTPQVERSRAAALIDIRSFEVLIDFDAAPAAEGVLVAHGDQAGGYVVFVQDGRLCLHYNEYGRLLTADGPPIREGSMRARLRADAIERFHWRMELTVDDGDDEQAAVLPAVQMLLGLAPFTGIDVGIDRGGPVSWPMHEAHGSFPYSGTMRSVTYIPGPEAPYSPAAMFKARQQAAAMYD